VLRIPDLKNICRQKHLPLSGSKKILIERILGTSGEESASVDMPKKVVDVLIGSWFMAPFGSANHATRMGSINESNVLPRIPVFLDNFSNCHIEEVKEYGLLSRKVEFFMAFSPDGITVVVNAVHGRFLALVEIKSRVTENTVQEETAIQTSHGRLLSLNMSTEPQLFKQVIPDTQRTERSYYTVLCVANWNMASM
jgi:hypothetical protein